VRPDGTLVSGSPGVTSRLGDRNFYTIDYPDQHPDTDVPCAGVVTVRLASNNALPPGYGNALSRDDSTEVLAREASGAVNTNGFNLAVFC
jgi:hypothetical protein